MGGERAHLEREKRKGDVVDFYTGICSQSGAVPRNPMSIRF